MNIFTYIRLFVVSLPYRAVTFLPDRMRTDNKTSLQGANPVIMP